jgi:hypothetical protein
VPEEVLNKAINEATWIFFKAGIQLWWTRCEALPVRVPGDPCLETSSVAAVSLGILASAPAGISPNALGFAFPRSGAGNHAAVIHGRVREFAVANCKRSNWQQILAYAMAHEIGHLLLRSQEHSRTGIMRGQWNGADLRAMEQQRLLFGAMETAALRRWLSAARLGLRRGAKSSPIEQPPDPADPAVEPLRHGNAEQPAQQRHNVHGPRFRDPRARLEGRPAADQHRIHVRHAAGRIAMHAFQVRRLVAVQSHVDDRRLLRHDHQIADPRIASKPP